MFTDATDDEPRLRFAPVLRTLPPGSLPGSSRRHTTT